MSRYTRSGRFDYDRFSREQAERARLDKCRPPENRPEVAKRLVGIIAAQRHGRSRPEFGRTSGRIDRRNLWRAATGDNRVFSKPGAPSPTRIRLVVLMDLSGSMEGTPATKAAQMCWDLTCAAIQVPTVTLEVWGHTTQPYHGEPKPDGVVGVAHGTSFVMLKELWKPGATVKDFYEAIVSTEFGGTEDGWVLQTLAHDVEGRIRSDERMVLIVVSDGEPVYDETPSGAPRDLEHGHVRGVVNAIRRHGHVVISVSCSDDLRRLVQTNMYGDGNVIEYTHDTNVLTQNIARVIGRALN